MVFQAYVLFFFICGIICVIAMAKHFYNDNPVDKDAPKSFWSHWVKFPSVRDVVEEEFRTLLVGLYYIQAALIVGFVLTAIFGSYQW